MNFPAPSPPFLGPANNFARGGNKPINRVVLHSTVGPTSAGSARNIARFFRTTTKDASAHYVVDAAEVVQVVLDSDVAFHAPPNPHSLGVEMCDNPSAINALRWLDKDHRAMFKLSARLVAELCLAYDVPPVFVNGNDLRAGKRGVTTHMAVRDAFKQTTHWDPGMWPRRAFMREVRRQVEAIKALSRLSFATWNVGDGPDDAKARGLVKLVNAGADVICLQECGDRGELLREFCRRTGWHLWDGDGSPGARSVPILWNPKRVRALVTGTVDATPATHVGHEGAGPATMKAKVWNRVRFATDEGPLLVVNGHVVPSLHLPVRRRLARKHLEVLARMVERRKSRGVRIVVVGDFNMRASSRLLRALRRLGMKQRTRGRTHDVRTIDHVWTLEVDGRAIVLDMPSDHNAVLFMLEER